MERRPARAGVGPGREGWVAPELLVDPDGVAEQHGGREVVVGDRRGLGEYAGGAIESAADAVFAERLDLAREIERARLGWWTDNDLTRKNIASKVPTMTAPKSSALALIVLWELVDGPKHVYGIQKLLRQQGKDRVVNVRARASLYQALERLTRLGLVEVQETV